MKVTNTLVVLFLLLTSALANDPADIPWPVGSTTAMMNSTKTLMNSYGDPQNAWGEGFHCGVDFDAWTEPPLLLIWRIGMVAEYSLMASMMQFTFHPVHQTV